MMTPTHLLVGAAALTRPGAARRNMAVLAGALWPDFNIYYLFVWSKLKGIPESELWNQVYWQEPWQTWSAICNSVPIFLVLLAVGLFQKWELVTVFALAALLHVAGDFPVHNSDAHMHFWPLTDWRFHSPLSYWDSNHYGGYFALFELAFSVVLMVVLWRRFASLWVRVPLGLALVSYVAVPIYFGMMHHG